MTVYADLLFILNFAIDYLILLCTAVLADTYVKRSRLLLGALFGGGYALLSFLPSLSFLSSPPLKAAAALLCVVISFGTKCRFFRILFIFIAVSAFFAGLLYAVSLSGVSVSFAVFIITFAVCFLFVSLFFRGAGETASKTVLITAVYGGTRVSFRALRDTGNLLHDPVSGAPVLVSESSNILPLFSKDMQQLIKSSSHPDALNIIEKQKEPIFRLVPYSSVGGHGFLPAFSPDEIYIDGKRKNGVLIALSPKSVSNNGTYSAVTGV